MIIDKNLTFSSAQAVTAAAASTDYVDLGSAREIGISKPLYVCITVGTTVTSGGAATVAFSLQSDDNTSFSSATDQVVSAAIGKSALVSGYQIFLPIPVGMKERYIRVYYGVATADLTAGTFTAQIVDSIQKNVHYPDAL